MPSFSMGLCAPVPEAYSDQHLYQHDQSLHHTRLELTVHVHLHAYTCSGFSDQTGWKPKADLSLSWGHR